MARATSRHSYRTDPPAPVVGPELVRRAVPLVLDGALDGRTEHDLGSRLAISARHLRRLFLDHLGVTPDQLARSRRAHFARRLLDDSDLTVTENHLSRTFRSVTGLTVSRYRLRLRARAALERLAGGERNLSWLAADLGFADHSHLCRVLQAEAGATPAALRAALSDT